MIDHDLCFKYHWTFNHLLYWLASEYLNIHFSSGVAVWVLSECSVNTDRSMFVFLPELGEAFGSDVLAGVLNASEQVRNKLVDGAFVLHSSGNTLSDFNLIVLTVRGEEGERSE